MVAVVVKFEPWLVADNIEGLRSCGCPPVFVGRVRHSGHNEYAR